MIQYIMLDDNKIQKIDVNYEIIGSFPTFEELKKHLVTNQMKKVTKLKKELREEEEKVSEFLELTEGKNE